MGDVRTRASIRQEAIARMKAIKAGEPVTNVCAGEKNPRRHAYFLRYVVKSRKTSYGIVHGEYWAKCTDKKGGSWLTGIEVIYPGHLDSETSAALWAPVWQANYGEAAPSSPSAPDGGKP